jgi:hypothetical protein
LQSFFQMRWHAAGKPMVRNILALLGLWFGIVRPVSGFFLPSHLSIEQLTAAPLWYAGSFVEVQGVFMNTGMSTCDNHGGTRLFPIPFRHTDSSIAVALPTDTQSASSIIRVRGLVLATIPVPPCFYRYWYVAGVHMEPMEASSAFSTEHRDIVR